MHSCITYSENLRSNHTGRANLKNMGLSLYENLS